LKTIVISYRLHPNYFYFLISSDDDIGGISDFCYYWKACGWNALPSLDYLLTVLHKNWILTVFSNLNSMFNLNVEWRWIQNSNSKFPLNVNFINCIWSELNLDSTCLLSSDTKMGYVAILVGKSVSAIVRPMWPSSYWTGRIFITTVRLWVWFPIKTDVLLNINQAIRQKKCISHQKMWYELKEILFLFFHRFHLIFQLLWNEKLLSTIYSSLSFYYIFTKKSIITKCNEIFCSYYIFFNRMKLVSSYIHIHELGMSFYIDPRGYLIWYFVHMWSD
jgi:hypothetical protein